MVRVRQAPRAAAGSAIMRGLIDKLHYFELLFSRTTRIEFFLPNPNRILMMKRELWQWIGLAENQATVARYSIPGFFLPDDPEPHG